jgi:methylmalonyl-CoA mutase
VTGRCISGDKRLFLGDDAAVESVRNRIREFKKREGRRPRILITDFEVKAAAGNIKAVAAAFANMGFDVDIGPPFQSPEKIAKTAYENDVHIVGLSKATDGYAAVVSQLAQIFETEGSKRIVIVVQGDIPKAHQDSLYKAGVKEILTPGMTLAHFGNNVLNALEKK